LNFNLITVLGPTATGKTRIAAQLATDFNGEIISADSRQVYEGMDIGTGKDLFEFKSLNIQYHLIDIAEPTEEYNLFRFTKDFQKAYKEIIRKKKLPIMVGGTGLYLSSILQNYFLPEIVKEKEVKYLNDLTDSELKKILLKLRPKLHNITDLKDKERLIRAISIERSRIENDNIVNHLNSLTIGIKLNREEIKSKITERLKKRLADGMIEEVEKLLQKGISSEKLHYFGLEYKYVSQYLNGELNYNDMFQKLNSAIHNFAKRQMTWFRKMEREGVEINWFSPENYVEIKNFVTIKFNEPKKVS
jgi:tRNA dimethylallyltransferase